MPGLLGDYFAGTLTFVCEHNEDGALEVETGYCNYLSLGQPSLADVAAGDTLHLVLWHGNLAFDVLNGRMIKTRRPVNSP